ncbi:MAG TPA: hypothetical protein VGY91_15620 [Chthoniobacterales bacterium]|jgi:hypothetical protein|nr:hypothetical protein [Chthoniobacterales bacterium]
MRVFYTKPQIARLLGMDARTGISRFDLTPDATIMTGVKKFSVYDAARMQN